MSIINCQLLIELYCNPKISKELSLPQWQQIILVLRHHQLLARYRKRLSDAGYLDSLPKYCEHHFKNAQIIADNQKSQVVFEAAELSNTLKSKTAYLIFLKGAAYTLSNHPVGLNRIYSDIDVLVDPKSISDLSRHLLFFGWLTEPKNDYDDKYYRKWMHEIPPIRHARRGTVVDIHHNIVPPISGRAPKVNILLNQVVETKEGYSILSPAAMTLHSAIHLFFNEDMTKGYRDLIDLDMLMNISTDEQYWDTLIHLAQESGFEFELFLACRYTRLILGTKIPDSINNRLKNHSVLKLKLLDLIFLRILSPVHPYTKQRFFSLAEFVILVRGHYLKMPFHILIFHMFAKSFITLTQLIFGKHVFEKNVLK